MEEDYEEGEHGIDEEEDQEDDEGGAAGGDGGSFGKSYKNRMGGAAHGLSSGSGGASSVLNNY